MQKQSSGHCATLVIGLRTPTEFDDHELQQTHKNFTTLQSLADQLPQEHNTKAISRHIQYGFFASASSKLANHQQTSIHSTSILFFRIYLLSAYKL